MVLSSRSERTMKCVKLQQSLLHRMIGVQPGCVPRWVSSAGGCARIDAISFSQSVVLVAAIVAWPQSLMLAIVLSLCIVVFILLFQLPFESVERLARARRRRGECVRCGANCVAESDDAVRRSHSQ